MSEMVGTFLGPYEIIEQIAKGGMATVYRAYQKSVGRDVAIKVLPSNFTHDDNFMVRFNREVEVIASLQHPHILPVYDYGNQNDTPYIVMAYLSGGTLGDYIKRDDVSLSILLKTLQQIADALDFAHSKGIIHRDLKPGNVLLDEQGNTYLADFGMAKVTEAASNLTGRMILGTPTYMAPEQASAEELTKSVDLYALGIVIYEMLTGEAPYRAASVSGILMAHVTQPVPHIQLLRPDLPDEVQDVMEKALAKEPDERYSTANELVAALIRAFEGEDTTTKTQTSEQALTALMMTNMLGHVIFVDNQCLRILKRHHSEARNIIGKPLPDVLGMDKAVAAQVMDTINQSGYLDPTAVYITDAKGDTWQVMLSASATRDDDGKFVGADITMQLVVDSEQTIQFDEISAIKVPEDTREEDYLQGYFKSQVEALYTMLQNWAGKRVSRQLEDIINETGQRNVWPVTMENGNITLQIKRTDIDIYQALLARAISYTASIIGDKIVIRELEKVNQKTNPNVLQFARRLELDKLYEDILR